jgi:hypothetical protein
MPTLRGHATVVLAGRATTVPFTTDLSGRKRTPTDIPMGTVTCAVRRQARWRPRPIWLCKQGVSSSRLRPVLLCGDRVEFSSGGATPDRLVKGIGRTVARSVCRSSGHTLGSQRTSLSGALLAATTRRPLSGMGQWPTSWNQSKSRVSMLPPSSHGLRPLHRRTAATCCMRWVHCDGAAGLVRLAGTDPTMSEDWLGGRRRSRPDRTGHPNGPRWVRMTPGTPGARRARAVTMGMLNRRSVHRHRADLRRPGGLHGGFESHSRSGVLGRVGP